jgi:hypothetical protein
MEQAIRPHRGETVFALGLFGLVASCFLIPLGIVAWIMGSRDLKGMRRGEIDPAGRTMTRIGWMMGIASCGLLPVTAAFAVLVYMVVESDSPTVFRSYSRNTQQFQVVGTHYDNPRGFFHELQRHETWQEVLRSDGVWVKEGPYLRQDRYTNKLEEGCYHEGKRRGQWTFWNEDGSMDLERSGIYEDDVLVQRGATPRGDYPYDPADAEDP